MKIETKFEVRDEVFGIFDIEPFGWAPAMPLCRISNIFWSSDEKELWFKLRTHKNNRDITDYLNKELRILEKDLFTTYESAQLECMYRNRLNKEEAE